MHRVLATCLELRRLHPSTATAVPVGELSPPLTLQAVLGLALTPAVACIVTQRLTTTLTVSARRMRWRGRRCLPQRLHLRMVSTAVAGGAAAAAAAVVVVVVVVVSVAVVSALAVALAAAVVVAATCELRDAMTRWDLRRRSCTRR
jgi:hypothetical protein